MATLTIRNLPDTNRDALRVRAAKNGRSMEAEVRKILNDALREETPKRGDDVSLAVAIRRIVEPYGGFELKIPPRDQGREPPDFT